MQGPSGSAALLDCPNGVLRMAEQRQAAERPLSPHLQIYRVTITMAMSILHRIVGVALYAGTALVAWWLIAAATGPDAYAFFQSVAGHWFGQLVLIGYTWRSSITFSAASAISSGTRSWRPRRKRRTPSPGSR